MSEGKPNYRWGRIERLLHELRYEIERGMMEREIDETIGYRFFVPLSSQIPDGIVHCEFRTRPVPRYYMLDNDMLEALKNDIERSQGANAELLEEIANLKSEIDFLSDLAIANTEEIKQLRNSLRFYADAYSVQVTYRNYPDSRSYDTIEDNGAVARQALGHEG